MLKQGVALTGRNTTGPPCSFTHRLACAGEAACMQAGRSMQAGRGVLQTTTYDIR